MNTCAIECYDLPMVLLTVTRYTTFEGSIVVIESHRFGLLHIYKLARKMFSRLPAFPGELKLIHWQLHFVKSCQCRMLESASVVLQYWNCSLDFAISFYNARMLAEPLPIPCESGLSRWDTSKCSSYSSVEEHRYRLNLILTRVHTTQRSKSFQFQMLVRKTK